MKIYVDDNKSTPPGWERAYTIVDAIRALMNPGVEEISLDHDPGYVHAEDGVVPSESFMAVLYAILLMPKESRPRRVNIHSMNPSVRKTMAEMLIGHVDLVTTDCPWPK